MKGQNLKEIKWSETKAVVNNTEKITLKKETGILANEIKQITLYILHIYKYITIKTRYITIKTRV